MHVVAAVDAGLDQLADGIVALGILEVIEALADLVAGVALEEPHGLGVVAPEVAFLAVVELLQHGNGFGASLHVLRGRGFVDRLDRVVGDADVVLQLGLAIADEDGAPGRNRTCNLEIRSLVLYPLSYGRP